MQASPTHKDIVTPNVHDKYGREFRKYLPVTIGTNGWYKENLLDTQLEYTTTFYSNPTDDVAGDVPYAETVFEKSPLDRVIEQGAPGEAWQPGTDRTIKKEYLLNGPEDVLLFKHNPETHSLSSTLDHYDANTLTCTKTIDEEGNDVLEFVDKEGRTICKKVKAPGGDYACTYYVYDDFGNLVVVIPPEGVKRILNPDQN
jgi:hypothetical protein